MDTKYLRKIYLGGFFALIITLVFLQVVRGNYFLQRAKNNYVRVIPILPIRGSIFDRNSIPIAYDTALFNIAVIPHQIKTKKDSLFKEISQTFTYDVRIFYRNYKRWFKNNFSPVNIIVGIDKKTALLIKEKFKDDVLIQPQPERYYPFADACAHILGYVKEASFFSDILKRYGYTPLERIGFSGIEESYNQYLKGEIGGGLVEVNSAGRRVGFLGERDPQRGNDIYLTIDMRIQKIGYDALEKRRGALILMNSKTGEIIALVSSPSFNPNLFVRGKNVGGYFSNTDTPLFNRAIQASYPLGSTIKPIMATAGFEENEISAEKTFFCKGKMTLGSATFRCNGVHEIENVYDALEHSCNVYFYNLGALLGVDLIDKWCKLFGLDSMTGIDLPNEKSGKIPTPKWKLRQLKENWFIGDTINFSIGQGFMASTPLEILVATNVFANGGHMVFPHLLQRIENIPHSFAEKKRLPISSETIKHVTKGLVNVIENEEGSAHVLEKLNLHVAGKTGTAQAKKSPHGWFVGFFPYQSPQYTICVFLEHAGSSYEALKVTYKFLSELNEKKLL